MGLTSYSYEFNGTLEAIEFYHRQGWTDGLPVIPPTEKAIMAMLEGAGRLPQEVLGEVRPRNRVVTAEKVAINAVMAGCLPAYMPVILAAVDAICEPTFSVHGPFASTAGMGLLTIVNGPVRQAIGLNCGENLFGPGSRANATIGRALRLILLNVLGTVPGKLDRSVFGHPGKYTYTIGEHEEVSPWSHLHVERGMPQGSSAVTVFACEGPHQVANQTGRTPEEVLATVADVMVGGGRLATSGQEFCVIIAEQHMQIIHGAGWSKAEIRRFLWERARRSLAELKRVGKIPGHPVSGDEEKFLMAAEKPEDIMVVAAGGATGGYSAVCSGWAGHTHSRSVTRQVRVPA